MKVLVMRRDITVSLLMMMVVLGVQTLGYSQAVCRVGDVIQPGERCTYPGTNAVFSVDAAGNARFNVGSVHFDARENLNIRDLNINGTRYTLVTVPRAGGGQRITTLGGTTIPPVQLGDGDSTLIPDPNLAAAIRQEIGTSITTGTLLRLTSLEAPNRGITDLTGLQYAHNLQELILGEVLGEYGLVNSNAISDLSPIAGLTRLTRLDLSNNAIIDVSPLAGLTHLTYLHLGNNTILDISPLAGLTHLTTLTLRSNTISDVSPLAGLTRLTDLSLGGNTISDISPLARLTHLTELALWENSISSVAPLAKLTKLEGLRLWDNIISDVAPLAKLTRLTELSLGNNTISDISPLAKLTHLTKLDLNRNTLSDVSPLAGLIHLTYLSLGDNTISDVSPLAGLIHLTYLSLGGNRISDVSPLVRLNLRGTEWDSTGLDLRGNPLSETSINTHIPALETKGIQVKVSVPSRITISGSAARTSLVNTPLDLPLLVAVLDDAGYGVADARAIFRVRKGQGRFSPRGTGRVIIVETDSYGYARADYTPMSANSTVEGAVEGVSRMVTFRITAGAAAPTPTPTRIPGTVTPVVHVAAAHRPPMLWVDAGKIYALVGADVQEFIPGVENAQHIAIGGNQKVYWTAKTGESAGTINAANLDGTGVTELISILSVPMGIAVDVSNSRLYWTNSRGRIQSANLDGSGLTNVLENLSNPNDLALSGDTLYWTHGKGGASFVNLRGPQRVRHISNGTDAAGSLVIAGGKIYWTAKTGESGGTVYSANLNGDPGVTQLASIHTPPRGIAVDALRSKLFWTNARGRIQSANLDGSGIRNVVDGLGHPGDIVLSNSIKAPTATPTTTPGTSKFDVNADGAVDSTDVDLILLAISAGVTTAKYDVNADGKVNVSDVMAVNANLDKGAAGAPTLLNMQFSALEVNRLQEQIDLLIATGDRSPDALKVLIYLQQLIAMETRPEKTQLMANYPNPFNPETWIPYELATDTTVKVTIYNSNGVVVRILQLGQQSAGYYTDRERAAYWDGKNAQGESVASGVYFYQLETDEMSSLRKMVILK